MEDKQLTCRDCRTGFVFSTGEQKFFEEKGFKPPARCKSCRDARKAAQEVTTSSKK